MKKKWRHYYNVCLMLKAMFKINLDWMNLNWNEFCNLESH